MDIVIIGGVAAGMSAAARLRRFDLSWVKRLSALSWLV